MVQVCLEGNAHIGLKDAQITVFRKPDLGREFHSLPVCIMKERANLYARNGGMLLRLTEYNGEYGTKKVRVKSLFTLVF